MKNNIENGIYIPDENRELHPLDEWMKREDPTTCLLYTSPSPRDA